MFERARGRRRRLRPDAGHRQHLDRGAGACLGAIAAEAGAALVIVNRGPTPYDTAATAIICDPIGTAVPQIAGQLLTASRE